MTAWDVPITTARRHSAGEDREMMEHLSRRIGKMIFWAVSVACTLKLVAALMAPHPAMSSGVTLPPPTEWAAPTGAPTAPGNPFPLALAAPSKAIDPSAPVISGWNDTAKPNESFSLSGIRFTMRASADAGSDTTVWLWADTPDGGVLTQAAIWKVSESSLTAVVPNYIPFGTYLVWVENRAGASAPICLNRATPTWLGPLGKTVAPGGIKRIFGKNLSTGHSTTTSYVYFQPAAGGALTPVPVTSVEPYAVEFVVPASTSTGDYKVYLHNGHGGRYGWGTPLDLTVATPWVRGSAEIAVPPSGGDDTAALQHAIDTQHDLTTGGTVSLAPGTYMLSRQLNILSNVRLVGASKDTTTIALRLSEKDDTGIMILGAHTVLENLTLHQAQSGGQPKYGPIKTNFPGPYDDLQLVNIRVSADPKTAGGSIDVRATRGEVVGCEFSRLLKTSGSDIWVHNNTFHGGPYGGPNVDETEAATYTDGNNLVLERNYVQTDWPVGPNDSRNYLDFVAANDLQYRVWAKRLFYTVPQYGSVERSYIGWNTTTDVAVDDNRGEMILFHGARSKWYAQVSSASGTTLTIRTDGLVDNQVRGVDGVGAATSVPNNLVYGLLDHQGYVVIVGGTGVGQARQVVSHTATTITVDSPWRIQPAADSKIVLTFLSRNHIVYKNDLNAFPISYKLTYSASNGVDFDGNNWESVAEGNTSRRTYSADLIGGSATGPSYWNELRDEQAYDTYHLGLHFVAWPSGTNSDVLGPVLLGTMVHGGTVTMQASQRPSTGPLGLINTEASANTGQNSILGSAVEDITGSGSKVGLVVAPWTQVLFRHNTLRVANNAGIAGPPKPVSVGPHAAPILLENSYNGGTPTYYQDSGGTLTEQPVALYRVVHVYGQVGQEVDDLTIPIANAGSAPMRWSVRSPDEWLTALVASAGTVAPEAATGQLLIKINTTGMAGGTHWGILRVTTASGQGVSVGVKLELKNPDGV